MPRLSFSQVDTYRQCPHKYWLTYREGWTTSKTTPALERGTLWHLIMEDHYLNGEAAPTWFYNEDGTQSEVQGQVEWMYRGYQEYWKFRDRGWKVLAVERKFDAKLGPGFTMRVVLDLLVQEGDKIWLVDHKSYKDIPKEDKLALDDQFGLYLWFLRQIGYPVTGAIMNVCRTYRYKSDRPQALDERFKRYYLDRSPKELEVLADEAYQDGLAMQRIKEKRQAPRHTGEHCIYRCQFTQACLAGRRGMDEGAHLESSGFVTEERDD